MKKNIIRRSVKKQRRSTKRKNIRQRGPAEVQNFINVARGIYNEVESYLQQSKDTRTNMSGMLQEAKTKEKEINAQISPSCHTAEMMQKKQERQEIENQIIKMMTYDIPINYNYASQQITTLMNKLVELNQQIMIYMKPRENINECAIYKQVYDNVYRLVHERVIARGSQFRRPESEDVDLIYQLYNIIVESYNMLLEMISAEAKSEFDKITNYINDSLTKLQTDYKEWNLLINPPEACVAPEEEPESEAESEAPEEESESRESEAPEAEPESEEESEAESEAPEEESEEEETE